VDSSPGGKNAAGNTHQIFQQLLGKCLALGVNSAGWRRRPPPRLFSKQKFSCGCREVPAPSPCRVLIQHVGHQLGHSVLTQCSSDPGQIGLPGDHNAELIGCGALVNPKRALRQRK